MQLVEKASSVVLNFKMDGQVKYAETLKQINSVMNVAAKEYKNHIASMGKDGSATDKLSAEKKKLEIQMEGAQKRTKMLSNEFETMSKDTNTTTEQLTKMQGKLLDSERAEISLQKSLDRVNNGLSDQATEAREAQGTLESLKSENKLLEAQQKNLTSSFKLQKAELGENASESEKAELAQKQLASQMELTDRVVSNLEQQLDSAKRAYGENSLEVMKLETSLNEARTGVKKFEDSLEGIEEGSQSAGDGIEGLESKLNAQALFDTADALQGISDKLIEIGKASFDSALSFGDSQTYLQANLGLTEDQAKKLNTVVQDVFKNGVVGSVEEAAEAVTTVKSAFEDLNNTELEELTNQLTTISKRTGTDVAENVNSAKKLMDEFGYSSVEAMNLLAKGYQNNLNKSGDFTDTINEYAPLFAEAGYSGEEMFALLQKGMENGARNSDLVADAIKELQIRFGDGSFEKNLESFSSGTGDLFRKWQNGEATMSEVMGSIATDMEGMTTVEQQEALSLLSTQFEDLGIDASLAILGVNGELGDLSGTAEEMSELNPTEKLQQGLRELQEILAPVGEQLVEFAIDTLPKIISAVEVLYNWFTNLSAPIQTFLTTFGGITGILIILSPIIATLVAAFIAFGSTMVVIIAIIIAVVGVISGIIAIIKNWGSIIDWLGEKWGQFTSWMSNLTSEMKDDLIRKIDEMKDGSIKKFNGLKDDATKIFQKLKDDIMKPINKAKDSMGEAIDTMKGFFDFEWSLPKLKMPHFSVSGSANPMNWLSDGVPKIKVDWRAKGAIFTQPTIFGATGGRLQGAGDAGPEAALPLNEQNLGAIGKGIAETMNGSSKGGKNVEMHVHYGQVNTNSPSEVAKLDRRMKRAAEFSLIGTGGVPG